MKHTFLPAADAVNSNLIPFKVLPSGDKIPMMGLGTFGSDHISGKQVAHAVKEAILAGYRHIDCASIYGNEKEIGETLKEVIQSGLDRKDLWITSKVWNNMHGEGQVIESCRQTLSDLQLDYLDLYLVHWPFPNHHETGVTVNSRDEHAKPYIHENYMKTWRQMEELVGLGLVRNIGTSNMTIPKLKLVLQDCRIKPACNQLELHPHFQQDELFNFLLDEGIVPVGYSPLGSPGRPERDRTSSDTVDVEDPTLIRIASRRKVHPAAVCIKWAVQRGHIPIPFSTNRGNILNNIKAVISESLEESEMEEISTLDKNCRLIKGQVFLWPEAKGWEDLWDINGEIAG